MSKSILSFLFAAVMVAGLSFAQSRAYAEGDEQPQTEQPDQSAMEQLEQASEDGQEAVEAPTDEDAKVESGETFDTPHDADGD